VVLERAGETTIVQAKHWRRDRVGVILVRELYGVQRAMRAQRSMFVAMGSYTADATQFAAQVGMTLVDGEELLHIIGAGLRGDALKLPTPTSISAPACPACGAVMVQRTAGRGPHAGSDFWGCSTFPACRGTAPILNEAPIAL
jgi:restriction system protein